jgi:BTB/POZ domain
MADPEVEIAASAEPDVEMAGTEGEAADGENGDISGPAEEDDNGRPNPQTVFLEYLRSPIVELVVSSGDNATLLTAHEALVAQSPYFAAKLTGQTGDRRRLDLPEESLDAIGCFLQYQYTGEYFPRRIASNPDGLETDPSVPDVDETGSQLLKHARVYTLAQKLGMPELKTLAHSKIHRINSTAVGEIAYARYVYGNTPATDVTIRKPVAAFWATRSHVLRHEAEEEFRQMCLEFPQFGFDVLNLVLDQREKRSAARDEETPMKGGSRKRMRPSVQI